MRARWSYPARMKYRSLLCSTLCVVVLGAGAGCSNGGGPTDTGADPDVQQRTDASTDIPVADTAAGETGVDAATDSPATDTVTPTDVAPPVDGGVAGDHLLITEIAVQPAGAEFIEIANRGTTAVDLSNYYISDNSSYYTIASGMPWMPITSNPGTDFLARFPAGSMIPAGGVVVVATDPMFQMVFHRCPDFILSATALACEGGTARAMVAPANGDLGTMPGQMLTNSREMVVLFRWGGNPVERLSDADYVTWGDMFEPGTRVDNTAVARYLADTAPAMQHGSPVPGLNESVERCAVETGERLSGGNGITGHDETSERLDMSFRVQTAPTPGVRNTCLP